MMKVKKARGTTVTKKENREVTLSESTGMPNDHYRKHAMSSKYVGASIGVTLNMENYGSLRVDVWGTEEIGDSETRETAFSRLSESLDKLLKETVDKYQD